MKTVTAALLSLTMSAVPASASYFFNSQWGTMLNVGSAPNPTPAQLRAIGDSKYVAIPDRPVPPDSSRLSSGREWVAPVVIVPRHASTAPIRTEASPAEEPRITADLNRASLIRARAVASEAAAVKPTKAVATSKASRTKSVGQRKPVLKVAATTPSRTKTAAGSTSAKRRT